MLKNKVQIIYFCISIFFVGLGLSLSKIYRPYIYNNNITDLGLADTIGSLVSVIACCFFFWSFKYFSNRDKNKIILLVSFTYGIVFELLGVFNIHGTPDWKDVVASFVSGSICFIIKEVINKFIVKENNF